MIKDTKMIMDACKESFPNAKVVLLSPGMKNPFDVGKISDTNTVPGRSKVDRSWQAKQPQLLFPVTDKNVRQGKEISKAYLIAIADTDKLTTFLMQHYNFRGFEFGNWLTEEDRQNYLYGFAICLYDLQQILGFEKQQIGLNGKLSICFGSRGISGTSGHFNLNDFLINLTRFDRKAFKTKSDDKRKATYLAAVMQRGIQSLVHEYGHALDYYCGTYAEKNVYKAVSIGDTSWDHPINISRTKFPMAYLVNSIINKVCYTNGNPSKFILKQEKETGKKAAYYGQRNEMFARIFEKYINYKMKRSGLFNVYFSKFKAMSGIDATKNATAYLSDTEFRLIEKDMDALIVLFRKKIVTTRQPKKECDPASNQTATTADVFASYFPVNDISTDPKRFQNREKDYSAESVQRIIESYDKNKLDAITVWLDESRKKVYVLSGHSRLEAHKKMKLAKIPVRFFEGSEKEAIEYAKVYANRSGTDEGIIADVKAFKILKEKKLKPEEIKKKLGNKAGMYNKLYFYSFLNPLGMFLKTIDSEAKGQFPFIENKAMWAGLLRENFAQLTNAHEQQMFNFLFSKKGLLVGKEEFLNTVNKIVTRIDFDATEALPLEKTITTGTEARGDTAQAQNRIYEIDADIKELSERLKKAKTNAEKEELRRNITKLHSEKESAEKGIKTLLKTQSSLFGWDVPSAEGLGFFPFLVSAIASRHVQNVVKKAMEKKSGLIGMAKMKFPIKVGKIGKPLISNSDVPSGNVYIEKGNDKFGYEHILNKHSRELEILNVNARDLATWLLKNFTHIYYQPKTQTYLIAHSTGKDIALVAALKAKKSKNYYTIITEGIRQKGEFKKYQLLWKRTPSPVFPHTGLGSTSMYNLLSTSENHRGVCAPKVTDTVANITKTLPNVKPLGSMSVSEAIKGKFELLGLKGKWLKLIGEACRPTSIFIYGPGGSGKSTFTMLFANELAAQNNRILYVAGEQFNTPVFSKMLERLQINDSQNFTIVKNLEGIDLSNYDVVVIDSKDSLEMELNNFLTLREKYQKISFVVLSQGTKSGDFTGSEKWRNEVDTMIKCVGGIATTKEDKNRWGGSSELKIFTK